MKATAILSILCAALLMCLGFTCTVFYERTKAHKGTVIMLEEQLAAAHSTADRWRVTATALQNASHAQSTLAQACLQREAAAQGDAAEREAILLLGPPAPTTPDHNTTGVSHATRRAAADYINRGL